MARKAPQFGFLIGVIRRRERNTSSLSSLIIFPTVLVVDLVVSVALERDMKNPGAGNHFWYFEMLHYLLFFSYTVLTYLQESSEIIEKTSLFPVPSRVLVRVIFANSVMRFTTVSLVLLSRIFLWLLYDGSFALKLALTGASLVVMALIGLAGAALCLRFAGSVRSLGILAGAGFLIVLFIAIPFWG